MMAAIDALIKNTGGNVIMLYATPDQIEREREALSKWRNQEWDAIPRRFELAKALLDDGRDKLRKLAVADLLAKAAPSELVTARRAAVDLIEKFPDLAKFGPATAASMAPAVALLERINLLREHVAKLADLDRLAKRSYAL